MTTWTNWAGDQTCSPRSLERPASVEELADVVRTGDGPIRVVGAGHSFGDLVNTSGAVVSLDNLSGLIDYDPATGLWSQAASLPIKRAGINGIAARGCLYVFGGEGNDLHPAGLFPENEVYNPKTNTWQSLEPIPTPVHGVTGAAYLDGWIHLPGGGISRGGNSGNTIHQVFQATVSCE